MPSVRCDVAQASSTAALQQPLRVPGTALPPRQPPPARDGDRFEHAQGGEACELCVAGAGPCEITPPAL